MAAVEDTKELCHNTVLKELKVSISSENQKRLYITQY